jgi:hypothetical protein
MRGRTNRWLEFGIALLLALAFLAWLNAGFTHLTCCSQEWVDSAPSASIREERAQDRTAAIKKVEEMRRRSHEAALAFLVGGVSLSIFCYLKSRRPQS